MSGRDADDELPDDGSTDGPTDGPTDGARTVAGGDGATPDGDGESEWRFSVDDVGPDGVTEDTATPEAEPIEPGSIELEHAALVVLGVAITVAVLLFGF
ncbi:hypothetical protein JCM17823_14810 [Halorubrum gandharaense]